MPQITARMSEEVVRETDAAATRLNRSRAEIVRKAILYYLDDLEDLEDLRLGLEALSDPDDPLLDWSEVRREPLDPDQG